ncbi:dCTP deaminase [Chloroflexales bacterium ZM16-3]|nr:dCTP deaminase [Chloroflexales bacterium ZM16-3]
MSIKADRWIRKMALEHGMIEPFVDTQVREGVISYGLTSYGYDMRVTDHFKVFTNVYNALVDPKNFNPRSFVDIEADHIDIPPNSFALAQSYERFRIPRSVSAIVIGKSTYARCFRGDTRVALVDGTAPTLEEMARRSEDGELFWGYSIGSHGRIIVTLLEAPRYIGQDSLIEIILDNGETINCTPDHAFLLRDGREVIADQLRPNDSLMPLYRDLYRGYEMLYQPLNGFLYPTHRLADEWNVRHSIYGDQPGTHRHHKDVNRRNNNPWNIERMEASAHIRLHNSETYGDDFEPESHSTAIKAAFERLMADPEWRERYTEQQRAKARSFWNDDRFEEIRIQRNESIRNSWTDERREWRAELTRRYFEQPAHRQRRSEQSRTMWAQATEERRLQQAEIARRINIREEITAEVVRDALDQTGSVRGAARLLNCDRAVFRRFPEVIHAFKGTRMRNHKVVAIRSLPGTHDVYCLTVPEAGNFALEAGVFVRNCGIIINVTPLEPQWEGYVTIEISNTTPLPARIYANEGIGQVLFFEGDEECETSYADKKGKYQSQVGIVLPRIDREG